MTRDTPTVAELAKDYEQCGSFLRRKDATTKNPSPLFTAHEVVAIALAEIEALKK